MSPFGALLRRDLALALRSGGGAGQGLVFFLIAVLLVPFGIGPDGGTLSAVAPGSVWIAALLACLLTLDRVFAQDFEDGSLDAMALSTVPLEAITATKALAHWLSTGLPLTLIAPLLALMLSLPTEAIGTLILSLALGTPALSLIGTIGAALTLGLRRGGLLIGVLTLPLYIPTLIFGARAVALSANGESAFAALALLTALTLAVTALIPFATAAILRLQLR